uniref:EGF-like domain-containing protein n=1 Tax=Clytia hemisphaerica TaxID=252671 RepID=A0A7M5XFD0_9CNID
QRVDMKFIQYLVLVFCMCYTTTFDLTGKTVQLDVQEGKEGIVGNDFITSFFTDSPHSFMRIQFFFKEPLHPINVFRLETTEADGEPVSLSLKILDDLVVLEARASSTKTSNQILGTLKQNSIQNLTIHFFNDRISLYNFCDLLSTKKLDRNFLDVLKDMRYVLKTFYGQTNPEHRSYGEISRFDLSTSLMDEIVYQHHCYKQKTVKTDGYRKPQAIGEHAASFTSDFESSSHSEENAPAEKEEGRILTPLDKLNQALELLKEVKVNQGLQVSSIKLMKNTVKEIEQGNFGEGNRENGPLQQLIRNSLRFGRRNACSSNPCYYLVPCFKTNDEAGYQCGKCPLGMEGDGKTCRDINECSLNPCSPLTTCQNRNPGYTCTQCPPGFQGNAIFGRGNDFAKNNKQTCVDVDECTQTPSVCPKHTFCNNTYVSYW